MQPTLIVLLGPTGVGKTALSLSLAQRYDAPILSADSRQIYRDLPIATAAATAEERALAEHLFVGTKELDEPYSAADFERDVIPLITRPVQLLVGGSMMYIDAVVRGIDEMPDADPTIRMQLRERYEKEGITPLLAQLKELDPVYYDKVEKQNTQRVIHGLEMCLSTGQPFSSFHTGQSKERPFRIIKIGLTRPRQELYERIDRRVDEMVSHGLIEETRLVYERYRETVSQQLAGVIRNPGPTQAQPIPNLLPSVLNTVGLKEMLLFHEGIWSLDKALERIRHNSHIYSKRQMTWFQRDPDIHWFHPDQQAEILATLSNLLAVPATHF